MKLVFALVVFFLALGLTFKTVASETIADAANCTAEVTKDCVQSKGESHGVNHGESHGGGHGDLSARMNSLFPEKQKNPAVGTPPRQTKLVSPKFMSKVAGGSVKLEWSETAGATNYHVQVATDPNFKWVLLNNHFAKGTSLDFSPAEAGKRYFWRVAAVKDDNISMHTKSNFVSSAFDTK